MFLVDVAAANLLSPAILCFALGAFGVLVRSDLRLPDPVVGALSIYLMLSIGLRGGAELREAHLADVAGPIAAAILLGLSIPLWCYAGLRRWLGLSTADAGALAAHYGSVSAVTFAAALTFLDRQGIPVDGTSAALLAIMEVPAIVVGIGLARAAGPVAIRQAGGTLALGGSGFAAPGGSLSVLAGLLSSKSVLLLAGGLAIGAAAGPAGLAKVKPLFGDLFPGALCLFLLELGRLAASRLGDLARVGWRLAAFAIAAPVAHAALGIVLAAAAGMGEGGAIVLGTLAGSASYIAAPAAVRAALPEASPGLYLTCSLAITFPFNMVVGLPLYGAMARAIYG